MNKRNRLINRVNAKQYHVRNLRVARQADFGLYANHTMMRRWKRHYSKKYRGHLLNQFEGKRYTPTFYDRRIIEIPELTRT